jgi:hypothetical protein
VLLIKREYPNTTTTLQSTFLRTYAIIGSMMQATTTEMTNKLSAYNSVDVPDISAMK